MPSFKVGDRVTPIPDLFKKDEHARSLLKPELTYVVIKANMGLGWIDVQNLKGETIPRTWNPFFWEFAITSKTTTFVLDGT